VVQSQKAVERSEVEKVDKSKGKASKVKKEKGAKESRTDMPIFELGKHVRSLSKVNVLSLYVFGRAYAYPSSVV
jgi:hypothetical protein